VFKTTLISNTEIPTMYNTKEVTYFLSIQHVGKLCPETQLGKGNLYVRNIVDASECLITCCSASRSVKKVIKIKLAFRSERCVEFVLSGGCLTSIARQFS
jgi:hypothetical protein